MTIGDMFSEEQLRALVKDIKAEQKQGIRAPRSRKSNRTGDIADICNRVQWIRHKRQAGELKSRKPYRTARQTMDRYEEFYEKYGRLEGTKEMFRAGQQERPPHKCKKPGMRNTCVRAYSGKVRRSFERVSVSSMTGTLVCGI